MSSSVHNKGNNKGKGKREIDNKGKDILILGEGTTQRLGNTTLTAEAIYPINFTQPHLRFVLSLHYNGSNSLLFVNATKYITSKPQTLK